MKSGQVDPKEPTKENPPRITLSEIRLPPDQKSGGSLYRQEVADLELQHKQAELKVLEEEQALRTSYSRWIFVFLAGWMISVLAVVVLDGVELLEVADSVLLALIGGTTFNVIGLFAIVARYFFPKR